MWESILYRVYIAPALAVLPELCLHLHPIRIPSLLSLGLQALSIYLLDGVPHYTHNFVGLRHYTVSGERVVPEGTHQIRLEFEYDGGGINKGGTATLFIDGEEAGQGRIEHTVGIVFATDETVNVGLDAGTTVSDAYDPKDNSFG
ncbi:MAG: hypothetical protein GQ560_00190, partial [Dehalococcoidia bacterium]|nr:hypothetical protein [Dehalococcoidia bacterium]